MSIFSLLKEAFRPSTAQPLMKQGGREVADNIPPTHSERVWNSFPVGMNELNEVAHIQVTNICVIGASSSEKKSFLEIFFFHYLYAPEGEESFYDQGLVEFFFIDPNGIVTAPYEDSSIATTVKGQNEEWKIVTTEIEIAETINAVYTRLRNRQIPNRPRHFTPSEANPQIFLVIDEAQITNRETKDQLFMLLATGTPCGINVIYTTRGVTKSDNPFRDNFAVKGNFSLPHSVSFTNERGHITTSLTQLFSVRAVVENDLQIAPSLPDEWRERLIDTQLHTIFGGRS